MMQISDLQKEQKIPAFFRLGFRPFFLGGAIFSMIALVLWLLILKGVITTQPLGGGYWWHMHEMVFGFASAIIAGFLLTAVQNWTGVRGAQGKVLIALFVLWISARLLLLMPTLLGNTLTALVDLSFLPIVAYILAKPILAIKQYRNLFFVPLLLLFTIANAEMHLAIAMPDIFNIQLAGYTGVMLVTLLMSVMAGRVVPMFTANGTQTPKAVQLPWLEKMTNGPLALAMLLLLLHPIAGFNPTFFGIILIIAGIGQMLRWMRWRPWITLAVPLLWSLHGALKFIWFGLVMTGISYLIPEMPSNHLWHLLTVGGIGGLILAMISRVSLGHTGRPLVPPKSMNIAFTMILVAALVRSFGPWGMPQYTNIFIDISVVCWLIAFGLFAFNYGPMLVKARKDGHPG
jgi:uncharacterized protein involved in response to NO